MAKCFVIMPLTTPETIATKYADDVDHFTHVLEHLFVPAIEKAGYEPVRPATSGSEIIQAHIIRSLQSADLVLCDISSLNANVFFELGIRSALNLPAVIVKDEYTHPIPFDTAIINHLTYDGRMPAWRLQAEIEKLSLHIITSANSAGGANSLWRHFGLTTSASPIATTNSTEEKLDYALQLLKSLKNEPPAQISNAPSDPKADPNSFIAAARSLAGTINAKFESVVIDGNSVTLDLGGYMLTDHLEKSILDVASNYGLVAKVVGNGYENFIKNQAKIQQEKIDPPAS